MQKKIKNSTDFGYFISVVPYFLLLFFQTFFLSVFQLEPNLQFCLFVSISPTGMHPLTDKVVWIKCT